jgi:hypothetical protein
VQGSLTQQDISNLFGVRRCVEHFSVTLEPLRVFLIRLNQPNAFAARGAGASQ